MGKANRNRNAGNQWERDIVNLLNRENLFPTLGTAREHSRFLDAKKIDIVTEILGLMEEFGLSIQAKNSTVTQQYPKLLSEIKKNLKSINIDSIPILFHKQTVKKGTRFFKKDDFTCLYLEDFLKIFISMYRYKEGFVLLNKFFDSIPEDDKKLVHEELEKLSL